MGQGFLSGYNEISGSDKREGAREGESERTQAEVRVM